MVVANRVLPSMTDQSGDEVKLPGQYEEAHPVLEGLLGSFRTELKQQRKDLEERTVERRQDFLGLRDDFRLSFDRLEKSMTDIAIAQRSQSERIVGVEEDARRLDEELTGMRQELAQISTGIRGLHVIARNEANSSSVERRFNGAIYQRLNERLDTDAEERSKFYELNALRTQIERRRLRWGQGVFWAVCVLSFVLLITAYGR